MDVARALDAFLEAGAGHCIVRGTTGAELRAWSSDLASRGEVRVAFVAIGRGASALELDVMSALFEELDATIGVEAVELGDTQTLRASIARCLREDRDGPLAVVLDSIDAAVGWSVSDHPFYWRDDLELFRSLGSGVRVVLSTSDPNDDGTRTFGAPVTCIEADADEPTVLDVEVTALLAAAAGPIAADELREWIGAVAPDPRVVGHNEQGLFLRDRRAARRLERDNPDALARARTLLNEVCTDAARGLREPSRYALRYAFVHLHRDAGLTERSWLVRHRDLGACIANVRAVRLQCQGGERTLAHLQARCAVIEATLAELSHEGVVDFDRTLADGAVIAGFVADAADLVPTVRQQLLALAQPIAASAFDTDPLPLSRIAPDDALERLSTAGSSAKMNAARVALLGRVSPDRARELVRVLFDSTDSAVIDAIYRRAAAVDSATADVLWTERTRLPLVHQRAVAAAVASKASLPGAVSEAFALVLAGTADGDYVAQQDVYAYLHALVPHLDADDLERLARAAEEMTSEGSSHFPDGSAAEWGRELARAVAARQAPTGRPWAADAAVRKIEKGDVSLLEQRAADLVVALGSDRVVALARSFDDAGDDGHRARLAVARAVGKPARDVLVAEAFAQFRADTPAHIDRGFDFASVADALSLDDAEYLLSALIGRIAEGAASRASLFEDDHGGSMREVLPLVARFGDAMFVATVSAIVAVVADFP